MESEIAPLTTPLADLAGRRPWVGYLFPPREVLLAFVASRAMYLVLTCFTGSIVAQIASKANMPWPPWSQWVSSALDGLFSADSSWYRSIAAEGYLRAPFTSIHRQVNWGFFPLYALLVRALGSGPWAGIALSNVLALPGMALVHQLLSRFGTRERASRALTLLLFSPTSYVLSAYRPESLFLLLTAGSFLAAVDGRFWIAGMVGGLAAVTRPQGILILVPLTVLYLQRRGWRFRRETLALAIPLLALGGFSFYLWTLTGHPLAWSAIQMREWSHDLRWPVWSLWQAGVRAPRLIGQDGYDFTAVNVILALAALGTCVWLLVTRRWALGLYATAAALMPLTAGAVAGFDRYLISNFGIYFGWAGRDESQRAYRTTLGVLAALWGAFVVWTAVGSRATL